MPFLMPADRKFISSYNIDRSASNSSRLRHSVDFIVPVGTPIRAAEDGKIVHVKQDSSKGGSSSKQWLNGNRIVISHEGGKHTAYDHIMQNSSQFSVGDRVKKGEIIALSGATGYLGSLGPHLSFELFIDSDTKHPVPIPNELNKG